MIDRFERLYLKYQRRELLERRSELVTKPFYLFRWSLRGQVKVIDKELTVIEKSLRDLGVEEGL